MLTPEQVETIKQRLTAQIEATFPEDRKQFAKEQIEAMSPEELEKFLIKNNLIKAEGATGKENCVFCSIVSGDIKSFKIAENKKAITVLEINPLAKGHMIVIPKDHVESKEEMHPQVFALAKKASALLKAKLKPKTVGTEPKNLFGHEVLDVVPNYGGKEEQKHATPEELSELQETLKKKAQKQPKERKRKSSVKRIIKEFEEKIWLPKRIP